MELRNKQPRDEITFLEPSVQQFIASIQSSLFGQAEPSDRAGSTGFVAGVGERLDAALARVTEFLGAEAGSIFLVDASTGDLVLQHATGQVGQKIVGLRLPTGQGVVGWVVKYSEDLIVPYPGLDTRFFEGVDESTGFSTHSILCCPIVAAGRSIGAVEMLNKREGTFNDDDRILLRAIARQVAQVITVIAR